MKTLLQLLMLPEYAVVNYVRTYANSFQISHNDV